MDEKKVYSAICALRGNPDFETFMSWIEEVREQTKELLTSCASDRSQRLQGEATAYGNVLKAHRTAPDVLKRLNTH